MRNGILKTLTAAALMGPALIFTGCTTGGDAETVTLADPVTIVDSKTGDSAALKTIDVYLIKTQEEYDALGDKEIYPDVDFEANDLVIAALGEQPTGGYSIEIEALQLEGDTIYIVGKSGKPAADAAVTQALTYPYAAAVIANTEATKVMPDID